jgi:glucose-1-phosphate adenylyltransferase
MMVVPKREIHQFGAGIVDTENRIIDWEEKPKVPRTNLASMGIYVFDTDYLLRTLARDKKEIDFGMHIIPHAIEEDRVFAYPFYGYWRDVGTIQSYWQTNMDILRPGSGITPEEWGIRPNPDAEGLPMDRAPARFLAGCQVSGSMVSAGSVIEGTVINSVLSPGVRVARGAVVRDSVIFEDCCIEESATVDLCILDKRVRVGIGATVGMGSQLDRANEQYPNHLYTGITLIGKKASLPAGMQVGRNCIIGSGYAGRDVLTLADGQSLL